MIFQDVYSWLQSKGAYITSGDLAFDTVAKAYDIVKGLLEEIPDTAKDVEIVIYGLSGVDDNLLAELKNKANELKQNPSNVALRKELLQKQVTLTAKQLGITQKQAADSVRSVTAAYAESKGVDPAELINSLTDDELKILDYSRNSPEIFGVDLTTANRIAAVSMKLSGKALLVSTAMLYFMIFAKGPKKALEMLGGKTISTILSKAAISIPATVTITSFLWSEWLGHVATDIPMITKQLIDNGSIGPGLRITAVDLAEKTKSTLSGAGTTGSLTSAQYNNFALGLEANGIATIYDPAANMTVPYTRVALSKLVQYVYGQLLLNGQKSTATALIAAVVPYLKDSGNNTISAAVQSTGTVSVSKTPTVKVFTGVMSQGTLGEAVAFTERQDDLITSMDELKSAASQNLAPWIASLLGRIIYEITLVNSVVTRDGTTLRGSTTQIVSGYTTTGAARYKNVTNKFAVMNLYAMTDKQVRVKLAQIVLGPTDAVKLQPSLSDMATLNASIGSQTITSNVNDIKTIATAQPITITTPAAALSPTVQTGTTQPSASAPSATPVQTSAPTVQASQPVPAQSATASVVSAPAASATPAKSATQIRAEAATNLSDWFDALGQTMPSLSQRGIMYANYGLGQSEYYAGTVEQNTKLLIWMKAHHSWD